MPWKRKRRITMKFDIAVITTALGVLIILTSSLTELFKSMIPKIPPQITATVLAVILTVGTVCAYLTVFEISPEWYYFAGAIVAGFMVSYSAQFGYDKLKEILNLIGGKK